jgi:redox-sensitive bicupin YhaK (pirin superfamily)
LGKPYESSNLDVALPSFAGARVAKNRFLRLIEAGRGMWHGGGLDKAARTRGFQLWIALPPELELGPTVGIYQSPVEVPEDGPARVLLGSYGAASNAIASPSPINYLAVRLKAGERSRYELPAGQTVLWVAIASGILSAPDELRHGDLAALEPSGQAVEFEAQTDAELVLGSAVPHARDLVLGYYSVHSSPDALQAGEAHIAAIRTRVAHEGRI